MREFIDKTRLMQRIHTGMTLIEGVRNGRWIWDGENWWHKCTACGMVFDYDATYELFDHGYQYANFCPNCGAKIGGGHDE